jgi:hypothetical protein
MRRAALLLSTALVGAGPLAGRGAEPNLAGLAAYADKHEPEEGMGQVTGIQQFSDVHPGDWAYQALSNLIERHGCVAGYPDGSVRGGRAMSRYEAAALLNACLDRISEVTDELRRLMK